MKIKIVIGILTMLSTMALAALGQSITAGGTGDLNGPGAGVTSLLLATLHAADAKESTSDTYAVTPGESVNALPPLKECTTGKCRTPGSAKEAKASKENSNLSR